LMRRLDVGMRAGIMAMDHDRIGPLGTMILTQLANIEPTSVQKLVDAMGRDNSQMTRAINKLESRGMLRRSRDANDGRVTVLSLTEKGHAYVDEVHSIMAAVIADVLAALSQEEQEQFVALLIKLSRARST
ncbi:MAG: MarR family transcriptional regulator, partial [Chloroflexota bacterium]